MLPVPPRPAVPVTPGRAADEIPGWFVWAALVPVAIPSVFALAYFQHRLFDTLWPGTPGLITFGLAIAVDWFGAMCGVYWLRTQRDKGLRSWGRFFAIAAVLGSTALMCWSIHRTFPGTEVAGIVPALIVFATTKLVTRWQANRSRTRDVLADAAVQLAAAEAARDRAVAELAAERESRDAREAVLVSRLEALEARGDRDTDTGPIPVTERAGAAPGSRVTNIAGSLTEQGKRYVREYAAEHDRLPSGTDIERAVGAKESFGRKLLQKMRAAGELPDVSDAADSSTA